MAVHDSDVWSSPEVADALEDVVSFLTGDDWILSFVARRSAEQIYIDGGSGYTIWKDHLSTSYGIPNTSMSNPWLLVLRHVTKHRTPLEQSRPGCY